jgi:hypothetical protein
MNRIHATSNGDIPFTAEEEAEWDALDLAWNAGARDRKAAEVRTVRNAKITACDWRMLTDTPVSEPWKTYRQALRDVPKQAGFPDSVVWPVEP